MARIKKKILAQELRRKGLSINEIAEKLRMQKSGSISKWCCNIILTPEQIERLAKKQKSGSYKGRMKFLETIRKTRMKEVALLRKQGLREIGSLDRRDLFISGIAMYWSEGYTAPSNYDVGFTNSDPKMILFMLEWFKNCCKISIDRFSLRVGINKIHKKRVKEVEKYWSDLTEIPLSQFNKPSLKKTETKKIYENYNEHFGTLRIKVRKGTRLRRKIDGWIEGISNLKIK